MTGRILVVTNDFPPRVGGIESFVLALATRLPAESVVVHTARQPGDAAFDATLPFPVVRDPAQQLLPTPAATRRVLETARGLGCDRVWFGAAAPLGLMAGALRTDAGVRRIVASTHGHEVWWARVPAARAALRRIGEGADVVTYIAEYTRARIARALGPAAGRLVRLAPGVDSTRFHPDVDGSVVRRRHRLGDRPVVVCVSRFVRRKGHDVLLQALPAVRRAVPEAAVLLVGDGPERPRLTRLAASLGVTDAVVFAGAQTWEDLPPYFTAGSVFCLPCRDRKGGLEVEGLGIVFLEAAASGLPVVAGKSGGSPDAVREGETGHVVDGRSPAAVADALVRLLRDPQRAAAMGQAGRAWVSAQWSWDRRATELAALLDG